MTAIKALSPGCASRMRFRRNCFGEVAGDSVRMIDKKKICVVLPAYMPATPWNGREIPMDVVDDIILVDDFSTDDTVELARKQSRRDRTAGGRLQRRDRAIGHRYIPAAEICPSAAGPSFRPRSWCQAWC
jgi:hypothetical protein